MPCAFRLLPLRMSEICGIALFTVYKTAWHLPAVLKIELSGHIPQFQLVVRQINGLHVLHVDTGPDDMSVAASFLFVEDDGAGLTVQPEFLFGFLDAASNASTGTCSLGGGLRLNEKRYCLARVPQLTA